MIVILADDLGIGDINGYYAASKVHTPNIVQLAEEGMRFITAMHRAQFAHPPAMAF